jgi:uncharacterized protein (TIGR02145 family)
VIDAQAPISINDLDYMQDFATLNSDDKADVLNSMTENQQYQLADSRDNKVYYISKLADGNVWMTQNLDFDIVNGGANINSANTDVPVDWEDAGNLTNTYATSDLTWEGSMERPESYDPGDVCWDGVITTATDGTLANNTSICTDQNRIYQMGNYYNWTASVAMADSSKYYIRNTDVDQSICPAGWTLPKSGNNLNSGSFAYLINQASLASGVSGNAHQSPYNFVYGGYWEGNSYSVGFVGSYSSTIVDDDEIVRDLIVNAHGVMNPNYADERDDGNSVRCVVRTQNP